MKLSSALPSLFSFRPTHPQEPRLCFALVLHALNFPGSGPHREDYDFPALPETEWKRLFSGVQYL